MTDFQIVHFSPGRLRVRLAQLLKNPQFAAQIEEMLSPIEGIRKISTSLLTGSLLVEYDPDGLDVQSLLSLGKMLNIVPPDLEIPPGAEALRPEQAAGADTISGAMSAAIEQSGKFAGKVFDPGIAVPVAALNAVAYRVGVGISPPAVAIWVLASVLLGKKRR